MLFGDNHKIEWLYMGLLRLRYDKPRISAWTHSWRGPQGSFSAYWLLNYIMLFDNIVRKNQSAHRHTLHDKLASCIHCGSYQGGRVFPAPNGLDRPNKENFNQFGLISFALSQFALWLSISIGHKTQTSSLGLARSQPWHAKGYSSKDDPYLYY